MEVVVKTLFAEPLYRSFPVFGSILNPTPAVDALDLVSNTKFSCAKFVTNIQHSTVNDPVPKANAALAAGEILFDELVPK